MCVRFSVSECVCEHEQVGISSPPQDPLRTAGGGDSVPGQPLQLDVISDFFSAKIEGLDLSSPIS